MGYSIAYNSGTTTPFGTFKQGPITMALKPDEYTVSSGFTWYANAEYLNDAYLIISDTYSQGWSTQSEAKPTIWRSATGTTESFVSLVNQLPDVNGVTGFTDSGSAMGYLQSTGKYFVSKDEYLGIVTDGLVLNLDAGWYPSYSGAGTTWKDLAGSNNGTLTNGPTFSGGSIVFDGVDDYVNLGSSIGSFNNATFSYGSWFYWNGTSQNGCTVGKRNDNPFNQYNMCIANDAQNGGNGTKLACFANPDPGTTGHGSFMTFNYDLAPFGAGWYHGVIIINNNTQSLYVNGQNVSTLNNIYNGGTFNIPDKNLYVGAVNLSNAPGAFWKSSYVPIVFLYNRALSSQEVLQNFNAQKGRFGL